MSLTEIIDEMKNIQESILTYFDNEENIEENFQIFKKKTENLIFQYDKFALISIFNLINKITNYHHRSPSFLNKLENIIIFFKEYMSKYFSNTELFNIFNGNKRILLFLIEEKILIFDEYIVKKITTKSKYMEAYYQQYFQPEITPFINKKWFPTKDKLCVSCAGLKVWIEEIKKELPNNFYEERRKGENNDFVCKLIQKDSIKDFIAYANKINLPLNSIVKESIYETNHFLIKKQQDQNHQLFKKKSDVDNYKFMTLIKYAAFYGSIQIFKYLLMNGIKLVSDVWKYAVHGRNSEILHILEENRIKPEYSLYGDSFYLYLNESIKCHHNDVANYIMEYYIQKENEDYHKNIMQEASLLNNSKAQINFNDMISRKENEKKKDHLRNIIKYHNFAFIDVESINKSILHYLCKYDYPYIINLLIDSGEVDINEPIIYKCFYFIKFKLNNFISFQIQMLLCSSLQLFNEIINQIVKFCLN